MALLTPDPTGTTPRPGGEHVARVRGHHRSFGDVHVLRDIDLDVRHGEIVALLGRSGCGKSTLLRSLAHLDPAPAGEIEVNGRTGVAFQEPRLLNWRTVHQNVALALLNGPERKQRFALAEQTLAEVGLAEKLDAWPLQLSGGQAQRVSLARALVSNPSLLLLDEPFSALDALTRIEMHQLVIELWRRHSMAILLVTHDVDEALALADRLVVMDGGRIGRTWEITLPRSDRVPSQPDIARTRAEVLVALGVKPTPPNPRRDPVTGELGPSNHQPAKRGAA
ncbi:ABC transporter ATP-binding protein [Nocardioides marmotae]|uniref:ATP-binding cassette domain-containing protein n=1 Tax=Nocardioides marmotae TaxID=2663857 RepID=A0A6I3JGE2_9ACTN|nr:ABC transporter ATP-binding protein [Nocardioides marmotae]MCR6033696.1 ATP-binding cassette domain-containing protein [Gordonia jinghuaiqii]MBC9735134.1 ABC transporter ATP-binding protein [Nocardioides marmotae]MTB86234.1 ATP-binding cassette domain-containing protein [Nocardioides marmotae]MTB97354.1 ATP-binding cassette domain-containing protein [Nocardioides marmotae]QKE01696.1 ABC transporter ATP-binding protein [Nocardioides marmotae]